jgi:GWxTD domain-containing protein
MKKTNRKKNKRTTVSVRSIVLMAAAVILLTAISYCGGKKPTIVLDPEGEKFYQMAHFLFTKHERQVFNNLASVDARNRFIKYFWDIRNPNPYSDDNEFKLEIEKRFDYVNSYLKEGNLPGWKTDRGRIYMLLGAPDLIEEKQVFNDPNLHGLIFWYYTSTDLDYIQGSDMGLYILFTDESGTGRYYICVNPVAVTDATGQMYDYPGTDLRLLDLAEKMKFKHILKKDEDFEKNNLEFQLTYDNNKKAVVFSIQPRNFSFDQDAETDDTVTAKIKIDLLFYKSDEDFSKHSEIKTITLKKEDLLSNNPPPITIAIPIEFKKGKLTVDALVSDMLGDAARRNIFSIEIK